MKKDEIVEILDKHLKTLINGKEDEWVKFEEMKTMPEYNAILNAMLEVAEKAVNKKCNLQNVIKSAGIRFTTLSADTNDE